MARYLVGGAVRDRLLGQDSADRDWVVVGATPEAMTARGFRPVGKDFPVFLHPQTGEEHALARIERKSGRGHRGFVVQADPDVPLEADLSRRDLTINAMAMTPGGELIDPWGGAADLQARLLRHVSPAFEEDPLRVLRVARFAARLDPLGFQVAPETRALMGRMVRKGMLAELPAERVWQETLKALCTERPAVYFKVLRRCGALEAVFPELEALFGVPQPPRHHPEVDSGVHTLLVLDQAARLSDRPEVRFAALLHDLGKARTAPLRWPRHVGHEPAGVPLIQALCMRLRVPARFRDLAELVGGEHMRVHLALEMRPETLVRCLEQWDAFRRPERFGDLLTVCEADARGRPGFEDAPYPQKDFLAGLQSITAQVQARDFVARGLSGTEIGAAVHAERVRLAGEWCPRVNPDVAPKGIGTAR
ncbi:MAG: multifunctional CCA addition/repair protein [Halothiobacillaceae bacterium]